MKIIILMKCHVLRYGIRPNILGMVKMIYLYIVSTMPFAGDLKPLENDVDVMNMVKCIRSYNEVEV